MNLFSKEIAIRFGSISIAEMDSEVRIFVDVAGERFNQDITEYMNRMHQLLIDAAEADMVRRAVGAAVDDLPDAPYDQRVIGVARDTHKPKQVNVNAKEISYALRRSINVIEQAIVETLGVIHPRLHDEIAKSGIYLTGSGAKLPGLAERITARTGMPCHV